MCNIWVSQEAFWASFYTVSTPFLRLSAGGAGDPSQQPGGGVGHVTETVFRYMESVDHGPVQCQYLGSFLPQQHHLLCKAIIFFSPAFGVFGVLKSVLVHTNTHAYTLHALCNYLPYVNPQFSLSSILSPAPPAFAVPFSSALFCSLGVTGNFYFPVHLLAFVHFPSPVATRLH